MEASLFTYKAISSRAFLGVGAEAAWAEDSAFVGFSSESERLSMGGARVVRCNVGHRGDWVPQAFSPGLLRAGAETESAL